MSLRDALAELYTRFDSDQHRDRYAAVAALIAEEEKRRVLQVGDRAPEFDLTDPDLGTVRSSDVLSDGPLVVNFYRGLWCSFCQKDLLGLEELKGELNQANTFVVAITHRLEDDIRRRFRQTTSLGFPIVDDSDGVVAEGFGIRWAASDIDLIEQALDTNIVTLRGNHPWILPMQARYVIDQNGIVAFANVASDYSQRSEPSVILSVLREGGSEG